MPRAVLAYTGRGKQDSRLYTIIRLLHTFCRFFCAAAARAYFHYDVGEFFADGIYRYYDGEQKTLTQACPKLTAFIENIVSES